MLKDIIAVWTNFVPRLTLILCPTFPLRSTRFLYLQAVLNLQYRTEILN